uniref:Uncharacterized protein n=1 Tax=Triticum urartu TaxID=4572 RepID=A0A8R7R325_TRIUA
MHMKTDKPPSPQMKRNAGRRRRHLQGPDIAPSPDVRPLKTPTTAEFQPPSPYKPRTSGPASPDVRPFPSAQISSLQLGNPDPSEPESNKPAAPSRTSRL